MDLQSGKTWSWIFIVDKDMYPDTTDLNQELRFSFDNSTYVSGIVDGWKTISKLPGWIRCAGE